MTELYHPIAAPGQFAGSDYTCVLFDLDGTITDSAPGIIERISLTLQELGIPVPTDLMRWVGPPLLDSFQEFAGLDIAQSHLALEVFVRHVRRNGPHSGSTVYPGIRELLECLRAAGVPMAIATSKPETDAAEILHHFGLDHVFDVIAGASEDDTRSAKADVIASALERLRALRIDISRPLMVGDRVHDVVGASAHGIPAIMVAWGYAEHEESADALLFVSGPDELHLAIQGLATPASAITRTDPRSLATDSM